MAENGNGNAVEDTVRETDNSEPSSVVMDNYGADDESFEVGEASAQRVEFDAENHDGEEDLQTEGDELEREDDDFRGPPYHLVPFKNALRSILNVDSPVFHSTVVASLASLFSSGKFTVPSVVTIKHLMTRLLRKFHNARHNMAYLTGCLVCVFRKMAERAAYPSDGMKTKLSAFMEVVGCFVCSLDRALYEKWFLCRGKFDDWVMLVACVFMPNGNFVRPHERSVIINAMKYLMGMVKRWQFVFREKSHGTTQELSGRDESTGSDGNVENDAPELTGERVQNCKRKLNDGNGRVVVCDATKTDKTDGE